MGDPFARAFARRRALGLPSAETNAYRLIHGDADELDGLTVDVYDQFLVASLYTERYEAREQSWIEAALALGFRGVFLKRRPRQANEVSANERSERAPAHAVMGEDAPPALMVQENGQPFEVRLGEGFSTGLFLDQRENRARLAALSREKSVLNLFSYTCAFGAVAAKHGAHKTVNIDVAKSVLERGRRNYELANVHTGEHQFLARDVLETLPRMAQRGERFDCVVLDPPSYASTRRGRFSVERDYPELVKLALGLVAERGVLLACTNHHRMSDRDLVRAVQSGAAMSGLRVRDLRCLPPPPDHPPAPGRTAHLKSAWIWL